MINDEVVSRVANAVDLNHGRTVILEGPPIYLWPSYRHPNQHPDHPSQVAGWKIVDGLSAHVPQRLLNHWMLIDDFNYRPRGLSQHSIGSLSEVASGFVRGLSHLAGQVHQAYWESEFVEGYPLSPNNECSYLDARFQFRKIVDTVDPGDLTQLPRLIVVHPVTFRRQQ